MANAYTPPEALNGRRRAGGQKLTAIGAVLIGAGAIGLIAMMLFNLVWLSFIGSSFGILAFFAIVIGAACFIGGFNMIKDAHRGGLR